MTMQKGDYQRISDALRQTRDATLAKLKGDENHLVRRLVRDSYQATAVALARSFYAVNKGFRYALFLNDSLGGGQDSIVARDMLEKMIQQ